MDLEVFKILKAAAAKRWHPHTVLLFVFMVFVALFVVVLLFVMLELP